MLKGLLKKKDNLNNTITGLKSSKIISLCIFIIALFMVSTMQYISLHNIDLAWNAERLSCDLGVNFIDDNGIVEQTPEQMYSNGFRFSFLFPVLQFLLFVLIIITLVR